MKSSVLVENEILLASIPSRELIQEGGETPEELHVGFSWLISDYEDEVWDFTPNIEASYASDYRINWFSGEEGELSGWRYWVDRAKELLVAKMESPRNGALATSSAKNYAVSLRAFYRYLFLIRNCSLFEDVTKEDVEAYKYSLLERDLKSSTVEGYLLSVNDSYVFKEMTSESLSFDPFPEVTLYKWAEVNGKANGHTPTLLPREVFYLLNEALKIVKGADRYLELLESYMAMRSQCETESEFRNVALKFQQGHDYSSRDLYEKLRITYGAALTVTFLLVAERKHEAALRKEDDLVGLLSDELDILYGLEKKTSGSIAGKKTEVAVIDEVKEAFKVIMQITQYKRKESGLPHVLLKLPYYHSANSLGEKSDYLNTQSLYRLLDKFAESCGLKITLRPHMLRRAYSMLWSWRYEIGDLEELSIMLKHNSLKFTKKYGEDENIWNFMPHAEHQMIFDILNDALLKKTRITGGASETLKRYGRIIQAKSKLTDPEGIAKFVGELIDSDECIVVPHSDGYCIIAEATLAKSKCLDENGKLSESRRTPDRCVGCPNLGIDDKRRAIWYKRIELHKEVANHSENSKLREISVQFIQQAEKALGNDFE